VHIIFFLRTHMKRRFSSFVDIHLPRCYHCYCYCCMPLDLDLEGGNWPSVQQWWRSCGDCFYNNSYTL
jgi:hypothetical protein